MSYRINLSSLFNMSLGFIPVILAILLGEFMPKDFAIYAGTLAGIVFSVFNYYKSPGMLPNLVLYIVTTILAIFTLVSLFRISSWPANSLAITLEIAVAIVLLILYFTKKKWMPLIRRKAATDQKHHFVEAAEAGIVSVRIALLTAFVHFAIITVALISIRNIGREILWVLQVLGPMLTFATCIVLNQLAIRYFNKIMSDQEFVPIINDKGDVTGKITIEDIPSQDNTVAIPIVRIALEHGGMLFLSRNSRLAMNERNETDTPLDSYLLYKDTVEDTVKRILFSAFPANDDLEPRFSIKYKFINDKYKRLIYLFILHLDDDTMLKDPRFVGGKLWTMRQIEDNLDKGFFTKLFEYEFDHLKDIIEIREKYKGS